MKIRKNLVALLFILAFSIIPSMLHAQTKRALLIGIDIYQPALVNGVSQDRGGWTNLDGCVNDATAIAAIIKARFGFEDEHITSLYNQDAVREKIIADLEHLIEVSQKGDVVFIYYAGHGSQVYNSLSTEVSGDKKDESIVPADMIDIRDKELAALFNRLLDKGVILTLIFDSCHSGSIARGSNTPVIAKTRHVNGNSADAMDPSDPQKPEDRGALIFSAAQPEQLAKEARDDDGNPHGAFTVALIKALNSSSVNESADVLFLRLKAIMQANGSTQEPVLGGKEIRRKQGLFGEDVSKISGKTVVAVLKVKDAEYIEMQGGWAIGLNAGCELRKLNDEKGETLLITQVDGMSRCRAKLKSGDAGNIKAGDLFEMITWSAGNKPNLSVWMPDCELTLSEIQKVASTLGGLAQSKNLKWITDPSASPANYVIQYYSGSWKLFGPENAVIDLGKSPTVSSVSSHVPKGNSLYLQLPPPVELTKGIALGSQSDNSAIALSGDPLQAQYFLLGSYENSTLRYAWVKPNIVAEDTTFQSTLPLRTDWLEVKSLENIAGAASQLTNFALRLGKVNAWLNLSSPPDNGSYPFSLALKNTSNGEYYTSGTVYEGEEYSLVLQTNREKLKMWTGKSRYIYVFTIDVSGRTQQIFPFANFGNEGNKLPNKAYDFENEIPLGNVSFTISEPFGVDSYFMISTDEAINNFQAFNSDGVVTRGGGGGSPLENLINDVGVGTRGISNNSTPANWGFQRIAITSQSK